MTRAWEEALETAREFRRLGAPERRAVWDMMAEMKRGVRLTADEWAKWGLDRVASYRAEGMQPA